MTVAKSTAQEKIKNNPYLFVNLVLAFFPISFIIGSFAVNLNLILLCLLGVFYLKSKILTSKFDFSIKIIFLFFFIIFFSTLLSFLKTIYFDGYNSVDFARLTKSILFFRFFIFLVTVYLLNKLGILNFRYFLITATITSVLLSLDIIYQYIYGVDLVGNESAGFRNSGFFGDEFVAGGYIQRFATFSILFTIFLFKDRKYIKLISTTIVICILGAGILFAGNRMPTILFIFGLLLILFSNLKIKKILLASFIGLFVLFKFIIDTNESFKSHINNQYKSFYGSTIYLISTSKHFATQKFNKQKRNKTDEFIKSKTLFYEVKWEPHHRRIFLAAIDTWRENKIFGGGIKSFRRDCWVVLGKPGINLEDRSLPNVKNRLCSTHPHNYYFEILTETGIVGLIVATVIALLFMIFIFKNVKNIKQVNFENIILLSAIISLILEALPLRSTGSLFTSNNATYLMLIASIVLCNKTLMKNKIPG